MHNKENHDGRCVKTAPIVENAHRIRRRMRDLREPTMGDDESAIATVRSSPRLLLFTKFPRFRRKDLEPQGDVQSWFVLGAWLFIVALIVAIVIATLHWRESFKP